jgi:hypothetical protein
MNQRIDFGDNRSKAIGVIEHLSMLIMAPVRIDTNTNKRIHSKQQPGEDSFSPIISSSLV